MTEEADEEEGRSLPARTRMADWFDRHRRPHTAALRRLHLIVIGEEARLSEGKADRLRQVLCQRTERDPQPRQRVADAEHCSRKFEERDVPADAETDRSWRAENPAGRSVLTDDQTIGPSEPAGDL